MATTAEVSAFLEDLFENLGVIEAAVTESEDSTATIELLHEIFRAAHTIKGNAAMMNLTNLVALGHGLETALQEAISGHIAIDSAALRLFNECCHAMQRIGDVLRSGEETATIVVRDVTDRIQVMLLKNTASADVEGAAPGEREFEIKLQVARAELAPAVRAFLVETKLAELGSIIRKEPSDEQVESPAFMGSSRQLIFVMRTRSGAAEIRDNLNIDLIENISILETGPSDSATETSSATIERQKTEIIQDAQTTGADTIRLSVETLDKLLNLTGELVIANTGLTEIGEEFSRSEEFRSEGLRLTEKNREIFRITAEIQNIVMKSRMLPLEHVFSRFRRFVRDYSEKAGKTIRLEITGADTEIDKRVIDEIVKPLTHLIRNSLDHGFESPEERKAAGKSAEGTLKLSATQAGSNILIAVEDDGRGMDLAKITSRAVEKNLVTADRAALLTAEEIREFIFMPGFSTKDAADELSGRGFGMDIVRDSIAKLSGDLTITSEPGRGTRMQVKLPLTLAIVTALTFRVRNDVFAIPLTSIEETLRIEHGSVLRIEGRELLHNRERLLPYLHLDDLLGYPPVEEHGNENFAIVVALHGHKFAFAIEQFLKKQELVVKSLGENYRHVYGLAGAAMLGNDEIVFILDLEEIVALYRDANTSAPQGEEIAARVADDSAAALITPIEESFVVKTEPNGIRPMFSPDNKDLVRSWISQSNKAAIKGMQMLTGTSEIAVRRTRGSRVKAEKSRTTIERVLERADEIILIHLPMLPAAGAIDLIMTRESAHRMSKVLFAAVGIESGSEFDPSPLLEVTNILGSAYTNTLSFLTDTSVEPATPSLLATPAEIKSLVEHRLQAPKAEILLIENQFHIADEDIEIELMIYLTGE